MLQVSISSVFENRLDVEVHKFFARVFKNINVSIKKRIYTQAVQWKKGKIVPVRNFTVKHPLRKNKVVEGKKNVIKI